MSRRPPQRRVLHPIALAGDLIANSAYYTLVGLGRSPRARARGAALGLLAGVGALLLPPRIGLGVPPHAHHRSNQLMTVGWYLIGGLVAAKVYDAVASRAAREP